MSEKITKMILIPYERYQSLLNSHSTEEHLEQKLNKVRGNDLQGGVLIGMQGKGGAESENYGYETQEEYESSEGEEEEKDGEGEAKNNIIQPPPGFPSNENFHIVERGNPGESNWITNWISLDKNGKTK